MKHPILFLLGLLFTGVYSQDRILTFASKDSLNGQAQFKGSFGANIKLNGYYDVYGGLQDSETFNVGAINVFGTDDSDSFKVDMYQTQMKFESTIVTKNGNDVYAVVEFDFWGGNGKMRLRKAYVEFNHWQIGQGWASFGDEVLWPNILEWEGPPSGVWVRSPHIKYFNTLGSNPNWRYIIALDAPITDYNRYDEIEPLIGDAYQTTPDLILGIKHEKNWGHLRMATIFRHINYEYDSEKSSFFGYGLSFSGRLAKAQNNFQFQGTVGKGITSYITSIAGFGYDGFPTINGELDATPSYGGWMAYEHFWTPKLHTNLVLGYTRFFTDDVSRVLVAQIEDVDTVVLNGNINHVHTYGIVNIMYDHFTRMTYGLELDFGTKKLDIDGTVNDNQLVLTKKRDAMRISFGLMFYF
ncbi:hypothetical protein [Algibacter mikhailovii]|uniref:hypothetical protein n=1 Tax=Algibacter mikhailovii TaxID=425498 RepID=UPI002494866F|nr:hypothetical protein [Algibacter mikhailovii]